MVTKYNEDGWKARVRFASSSPVAYHPRHVLITGREATDRAVTEIVERFQIEVVRPERLGSGDDFKMTVPDSIDVSRLVAELGHLGIQVELDHVLFVHSYRNPGGGFCCGCPSSSGPGGAGANPVWSNSLQANPVWSNSLQANPVWSNPVWSNPVWSNPVWSNPVWSNPVWSNPVWSNPVWSNPVWSQTTRDTGIRPSLARPADAPERAPVPVCGPGRPKVFVVDTGVAFDRQLPDLLSALAAAPAVDREVPDSNGDDWLDPAAGHGTFVAGIIEQIVAGVPTAVIGAVNPLGDTLVSEVVDRLDQLLPELDESSIVNLSFGGYADAEMAALGAAVRRIQATGAVVVASAGNDGTCRRSYPAAFADVVSVASVDAAGPAPYSNFGPWVRACAPGTDVVSSFFANFDGPLAPALFPGAQDPDLFASWARWTGTSFAAPIVTAVLARHIAQAGVTANQAVESLIDAPGLIRFPRYGTVINETLT